jgi:hypothetical protein
MEDNSYHAFGTQTTIGYRSEIGVALAKNLSDFICEFARLIFKFFQFRQLLKKFALFAIEFGGCLYRDDSK